MHPIHDATTNHQVFQSFPNPFLLEKQAIGKQTAPCGQRWSHLAAHPHWPNNHRHPATWDFVQTAARWKVMVRNGELCVVFCHEWTDAWASLTVSRSMTKGIPCSPSKGMTNPERRDKWWNLEHFLGDWIGFFREVWNKGIDPWTSLIPASCLRISPKEGRQTSLPAQSDKWEIRWNPCCFSQRSCTSIGNFYQNSSIPSELHAFTSATLKVCWA